MKKTILILLLSSLILATGLATFDAVAGAAAIKRYKQLKTMTENGLKQIRNMEKMVEGLGGVRGEISGMKKSIYGEINYWKATKEGYRKNMQSLRTTVMNTDKNIESMFDTSDGNYYSDTNMDDYKITAKWKKSILKEVNKALKLESEMAMNINISKMDNEGKFESIQKQRKYIEKVDKLKTAIASGISYNFFTEFLANNKAKNDTYYNTIDQLQEAIDNEKSLHGQTQITNRLMLMLIEQMKEIHTNNRQYQTAILLKQNKILTAKNVSLEILKFNKGSKLMKTNTYKTKLINTIKTEKSIIDIITDDWSY
jgi:anti-sigma28 factor (negative regulator of flagellin synthesis)